MITVDTSKKVMTPKLPPMIPPVLEAMIRKPLGEVPDFTRAMALMDRIPGLRQFYETRIRVTFDKSVQVFQETPDQHKNEKWHEYRDCRIPSSLAWFIFRAQKPHTRLDYWTKVHKDNAYFRHGRKFEPFE